MSSARARAQRPRVPSGNGLYDDINITPMLDLAYVLLVMFIILTTAAVAGVRVHVPPTQSGSNLLRPQTRAITITADGAIYLDAYPVTLAQLRRTLAWYKSADPGLAVVLRGDGATRYVRVKEILELAKSLGILELGLATRPGRAATLVERP